MVVLGRIDSEDRRGKSKARRAHVSAINRGTRTAGLVFLRHGGLEAAFANPAAWRCQRPSSFSRLEPYIIWNTASKRCATVDNLTGARLNSSDSLRLSDDMAPHIYLNTLGQPIQMGISNWRDVLPIGQQSRPSFSLWGRWGKGEIVADDRHTLSQAFLPDGTLRLQGPYPPASQQEDVQVTLHEGTHPQWEAACTAALTRGVHGMETTQILRPVA